MGLFAKQFKVYARCYKRKTFGLRFCRIFSKGKKTSENAGSNLSKKGNLYGISFMKNDGLFVRRIYPKPQLGWSSLSYHGNHPPKATFPAISWGFYGGHWGVWYIPLDSHHDKLPGNCRRGTGLHGRAEVDVDVHQPNKSQSAGEFFCKKCRVGKTPSDKTLEKKLTVF